MTNADTTMPKDSANPICDRVELPASISVAKVPARITPAAAIVGPEWRIAVPAASCGPRPSRASSRSRETIRML